MQLSVECEGKRSSLFLKYFCVDEKGVDSNSKQWWHCLTISLTSCFVPWWQLVLCLGAWTIEPEEPKSPPTRTSSIQQVEHCRFAGKPENSGSITGKEGREKDLSLRSGEAATIQTIIWNVSYTLHEFIDLAPTSRYLTFGYQTRKGERMRIQIIQYLKRWGINESTRSCGKRRYYDRIQRKPSASGRDVGKYYIGSLQSSLFA